MDRTYKTILKSGQYLPCSGCTSPIDQNTLSIGDAHCPDVILRTRGHTEQLGKSITGIFLGYVCSPTEKTNCQCYVVRTRLGLSPGKPGPVKFHRSAFAAAVPGMLPSSQWVKVRRCTAPFTLRTFTVYQLRFRSGLVMLPTYSESRMDHHIVTIRGFVGHFRSEMLEYNKLHMVKFTPLLPT